MLRSIFAASRNVLQTTQRHVIKPTYISLCVTQQTLNYSKAAAINNRTYFRLLGQPKYQLMQSNGNLLEAFSAVNAENQTRTLTKFSLSKGKRKSVKAVLKKFYRLNWYMFHTHEGDMISHDMITQQIRTCYNQCSESKQCFRGIWIRGKCGREKKLYKKSSRRKRRLRQHVFCNATQSWLLDSMVTKYWRRPKYYVDDPYEPYHSREEYPLTRRKPYEPLD